MPTKVQVSSWRDSDGTVEFAGSREALTQLATFLRSQRSLTADLDVPVSGSPDTAWLNSASVRLDDDLLLVTSTGGTVMFVGSQPARELLAENIEAFAGGQDEPD